MGHDDTQQRWRSSELCSSSDAEGPAAGSCEQRCAVCPPGSWKTKGGWKGYLGNAWWSLAAAGGRSTRGKQARPLAPTVDQTTSGCRLSSFTLSLIACMELPRFLYLRPNIAHSGYPTLCIVLCPRFTILLCSSSVHGDRECLTLLKQTTCRTTVSRGTRGPAAR